MEHVAISDVSQNQIIDLHCQYTPQLLRLWFAYGLIIE